MTHHCTSLGTFAALFYWGLAGAVAQENPWRVPEPPAYANGQAGAATTGWGYAGQVPTTNAPAAACAQGAGSWPDSQTAAPLPPASANRQAALQPSGGAAGLPWQRTIVEGANVANRPSGAADAPGQRASCAAASAARPAPNTFTTYGEFPPPEGQAHAGSGQGFAPAPPPSQPMPYPPPRPGYAGGYGAYADPLMAGPSTLNGPWGAPYGTAFQPYAGAYGLGLPAPYGW